MDRECEESAISSFTLGYQNRGEYQKAIDLYAQPEIQQQTEHPDWHSPYYWAAFTLQGEWQ